MYVGLAKSVVCTMCNNYEIYIVFTAIANPQMSPTEPGDSSESELNSDTEGAQELMIGDTPNKVSVLKEMFKDIDSEKIASILYTKILPYTHSMHFKGKQGNYSRLTAVLYHMHSI